MFGKTHSEETKEKQRLKALNRIKEKCEYCNKEVSPSMFARWHGDNCKNKIIK